MKRLLVPQRVRRINSSFAFIEHRFLQDGFFAVLSSNELLLYLFLVLAADRFPEDVLPIRARVGA